MSYPLKKPFKIYLLIHLSIMAELVRLNQFDVSSVLSSKFWTAPGDDSA